MMCDQNFVLFGLIYLSFFWSLDWKIFLKDDLLMNKTTLKKMEKNLHNKISPISIHKNTNISRYKILLKKKIFLIESKF